MGSWRLGSVRGIDLKVHFTFPLAVLWGAFQWGVLLEGGLPGALFGGLVVLLLFGCVVLHELGHAVAAQSYGIKVMDITLLPIGGVAQLRVMPDSPKQELVIALAGPLVNVVIAALLWPLVSQSGISAITLSLNGLLFYMFIANIGLAIFNMVPAFPMDGGRVLRATLALFIDYSKATTVAVRLAQLIAAGFVVVGVLHNLLLIFVAFFVWTSAGAELKRLALRDVLIRATVGPFARQSTHPLSPMLPLQAARMIAYQTGYRAFPVVAHGQLVGVVGVHDLSRLSGGSVSDVMHADYPVLHPLNTLYDARMAMAAQGQSVAAVMDGSAFLGLISLDDVDSAYTMLNWSRPRLRYA